MMIGESAVRSKREHISSIITGVLGQNWNFRVLKSQLWQGMFEVDR